ncbi:RluA family pseudouridine synthase [Ramlibacter sp. MAHUQ-53]|uniref:RluA family pseudouridine synthase n=1 Tax=unclassified Ramlibacter TaxID=2617605 RepID=UPI0036321C09
MTDGSVPSAGPGGRAPVVLHADPALLALDKPSGLLCVPGRGPGKQDCLAARVQAGWPDALVVHRLDMATSGLWLMARGPAMQRALSMAFEARRVDKRYVAVVSGRLAPPDTADGWGLVDLPLAADWPNRPLQKVDPVHGRPSRTRWRVLGHEGDTTRVELEPLTGRSHQLRVHLLALGHPILGDTLYAPPAVRDRAPRLLLHACALRLAHPATGEPLALDCPPPF